MDLVVLCALCSDVRPPEPCAPIELEFQCDDDDSSMGPYGVRVIKLDDFEGDDFDDDGDDDSITCDEPPPLTMEEALKPRPPPRPWSPFTTPVRAPAAAAAPAALRDAGAPVAAVRGPRSAVLGAGSRSSAAALGPRSSAAVLGPRSSAAESVGAAADAAPCATSQLHHIAQLRGLGGRFGAARLGLHLPTLRLVALHEGPRRAEAALDEARAEHRLVTPLEGAGESECDAVAAFHGAFADGPRRRMTLVVEYMDGGSLQGVQLASDAHVAHVGLSVARALAHLHARGVVHSDVQPSNCLTDSHGRVKLADLGLANTRLDLNGAPHSTARCASLDDMLPGGSLGFFSPARLASARPAPADDVWALGVTLLLVSRGPTAPFGSRFVRDLRGHLAAQSWRGVLDEPLAGCAWLGGLLGRILADDASARPTAAALAACPIVAGHAARNGGPLEHAAEWSAALGIDLGKHAAEDLAAVSLALDDARAASDPAAPEEASPTREGRRASEASLQSHRLKALAGNLGIDEGKLLKALLLRRLAAQAAPHVR